MVNTLSGFWRVNIIKMLLDSSHRKTSKCFDKDIAASECLSSTKTNASRSNKQACIDKYYIQAEVSRCYQWCVLICINWPSNTFHTQLQQHPQAASPTHAATMQLHTCSSTQPPRDPRPPPHLSPRCRNAAPRRCKATPILPDPPSTPQQCYFHATPRQLQQQVPGWRKNANILTGKLSLLLPADCLQSAKVILQCYWIKFHWDGF